MKIERSKKSEKLKFQINMIIASVPNGDWYLVEVFPHTRQDALDRVKDYNRANCGITYKAIVANIMEA